MISYYCRKDQKLFRITAEKTINYFVLLQKRKTNITTITVYCKTCNLDRHILKSAYPFCSEYASDYDTAIIWSWNIVTFMFRLKWKLKPSLRKSKQFILLILPPFKGQLQLICYLTKKTMLFTEDESLPCAINIPFQNFGITGVTNMNQSSLNAEVPTRCTCHRCLI
jgi:hypothetical protein